MCKRACLLERQKLERLCLRLVLIFRISLVAGERVDQGPRAAV